MVHALTLTPEQVADLIHYTKTNTPNKEDN